MSKTFAFRRPATIALALTLSLGLAACGGTPMPTVTAISIGAVSGDNQLTVGEKFTATATVTGDNNPSQSVTWTSSDTKVATVDTNGVITAVAPGKATITATSSAAGYTSVTGTVNITVVAATSTTPTVTAVTVSAPKTSLRVAETTQATATVTGTNNPSQAVTFTSSAPTVATVSATGLVTAVAPGTADIIATSTADPTKSGKVTITVTAAPVTLTPAVNINFQPAASATPAGYVANNGAQYDPATGIGWVTEATAGTATPAPLDMTTNTRDRSGRTDTVPGLSAEQYTQLNMQCGTATPPCITGTPTSGAFEYRVVNGQYSVTVSVGETVKGDLAGSTMNLNVENINFSTGFTPTEAKPSDIITKTVTVTDGRLTVDAKGGKNTKIQYLKIAPAQ